MASPTGIIPDELMTPYKRMEAFRFVKGLPLPGEFKVSLWLGWCQWCLTHNTPQERRELERSGIDG